MSGVLAALLFLSLLAALVLLDLAIGAWQSWRAWRRRRFVREQLRAIASTCDIGFLQIAQVFDSSYAAQRLEVVDIWRKVARDRGQFVNDFAKPLQTRDDRADLLIYGDIDHDAFVCQRD